MEHIIDLLVVAGFACLTVAVVLWIERELGAAVWRQEWRRRWGDGGDGRGVEVTGG